MRNDFKKIITDRINSGTHRFLSKEIKKDNEFLEFINLETKFLDENLSYIPSIPQRIWHVYNNSTNIHTCRECGDEVGFIKLSRGYSLTCSMTCKNGAKTQENIKNTLTEKYGVDNAGQIPEVKDKIKNTLNLKYGVDNAMNIGGVKVSHKKSINKTISKHGDSIIKKRVETLKSNFGVNNISKLDSVKLKKEKTCIKNFGVSSPLKNEYIKQRVKLTNQERYGGNSPMCDESVRDKSIKTSLEKYGVPYPMQNENVFTNNQKSRFRKKEYTFPSGKKVSIQGYENRAIDLLLESYEESDLVIRDKKIEEFIGEIWYIGEDNKKHRYYPDIFIISENKIIEVKSDWTFNLHKNMNLLKKESCINNGIDFEFFIFNKKQRVDNSTL